MYTLQIQSLIICVTLTSIFSHSIGKMARLLSVFVLLYIIHPICCIPHDELRRPGALIQHLGTALVVEDVLNLRVPLQPLDSLKLIIPEISATLGNVSSSLKSLEISSANSNLTFAFIATYNDMYTMSSPTQLLNILYWKVEFAERSMLQLQNTLPWKFDNVQSHSFESRKKRGLFDLGGMVLGTIFGLATEGQMEEIASGFKEMNDILHSQERLINAHSVMIERMIEQLHQVTSRVNELSNMVQSLWHSHFSLYQLVIASEYISAMQLSMDKLQSYVS